MLQIVTLYLNALKDKIFIAFMMFVIKAIAKFEIIEQKFPYYVGQVRAAYEEMDQVFLKYDVDFCSKEVHEADDARNGAFTRMRNAIRAYILLNKSEAQTQAAEILLKIIELYGGANLVNQGLTAKTASIVNLVDDLEQKYEAQVETLEVGEQLAALKLAQQDFEDKYMRRAECNSEVGKGAMAEARRRMAKAYRDLVAIINLEAQHDTDGELTEFIKLLNVEIGKNRTYTGQGQVGGTGTGESEEASPLTKTATFHFLNGDTIKRVVEVGALLVAPTNTEGYKWRPEVPEFMPEKNCTFREVPIDEREATATFHFFDHTEEEIRQIVGSVLHAPENTPGYYWDPEVPAVMPEENTQYYELPEEEEQQEPTLYTATFVVNGATVATQQYEAGEVINAPEPPSGYDWEDYPYRMPAEDITVNAVRRYVPGGGGGSGFE